MMQSSLERREIWAQAEAVVGELNERGEEAKVSVAGAEV